MKYFVKKTAVLFFCVAVFLISCGKKEKDTSHLNIAVSSYVPYTFAKSVLGDAANLTLLIPPGTEAHAFEPTPKTIKELKRSQIFFYISNTLEPWAQKLDKNAVMLAENLPQVLPQDPHVWMSFDNAEVMTQNLANYIIKIRPDLEIKIKQNLFAFSQEMESLKYLYSNILPTCQNRTIYHIGHLAFGYIARDYNLKFEALFSADMGQEPSAKEIAELVKAIKENKVKYIFSEEQLNPALALTISEETGAEILMLNTIEGISKQDFSEGKTYQALMLENLKNLAVGLECKRQ
ncbi:MAG: zinc ABC transporter substrate-binding protein [Elusimicrobiaceae bacterium]|nr:zinc ABC transporter substrate-binding protein [Elusimicrobiaceae bacterium]